ncbi:hypothetical protein RB195_005883 [Necator americanus]|uniref:ZP domain-containing protein n=1 Tax=Necator americanus TaxID=51031 RepID=A0ABR1BQ41_NECAM
MRIPHPKCVETRVQHGQASLSINGTVSHADSRRIAGEIAAIFAALCLLSVRLCVCILPPVFEEEDMYERENWSLFPSNSWFLTNGAFVSTHSPHTHVDSNGFTMAPCTVESKNRNIIHRQENIMSFVEHAEDRRINSLEVSCSFKFLDTSMHITSRRERSWIDSDGCRLRTLVALSRLTSVFTRYR